MAIPYRAETSLIAGSCTLEIARREDGGKVDAIVIMAVE